MAGLGRTPSDSIQPRPAGYRTPISVEQHRIWLHTALDPELPIYNEAITIHRYGLFDLTVLESSFNHVLKRHEAWRTSFDSREGDLLQIIHPAWHVTLPLTDLTGFPEDQREIEACRLASEDSVLPFDLINPPLFRARVFRLSQNEHWLQLTLHHIIFDGVSIHRTFLPELGATYAAFIEGKEAPVTVPVLQYGDYAVWREKRLSTPAIEQHLEYWRGELAGKLPILRLPTDRPRPAALSHRGAMECFTITKDLTHALRKLSRAHGVTLYITLLAALKTLFFRYSGQEDVIVGGLADGRRRPELENVMGYFLDTFAVRTSPTADLPFSKYLAAVRHSVFGALAAADVPFSRVVQALQSYRDHSHHPIFQTFLSVQPQAETVIEGWSVSKTNVVIGAAKFDLYIEVEERPDHIGVRLMYSTDLFDKATIQRMEKHWEKLLTAITATPDCTLGQFSFLTDDERHQMLVTWNQQERSIPELALHEAIEAQVRRTPDRLAVTFEDQSLSYMELDQRAERLAQHLETAGAGPGLLVAICLDRSLDLSVALFAVLKTGAGYLPLDPGTPQARRQLCLDDAQPKIVLTQRSLTADLPPTDAVVLVLEDLLVQQSTGPVKVRVPINLESVAYVLHTSGSTGRPKGVEISHRAIVNLLESMREKPGFTADDTLLALTTISFDIAGLELFLPLISGGHIFLVSRTVALDPYLLSSAIDDSSCSVLQATPATWRSLLGIGWRGKPKLRVLCGGEAMTRDLANDLLALGLEVWNVYGPTETTIWSTIHKVTPGFGPVAVGRPIANTHTFILDQQNQIVPVGVTGELYIGGSGLANGYRGQPLLTAEKFVVDVGSISERLYKTGDKALYREDGRIEIQGRADNQVKVRGYRIELEDVESSLLAHVQVASAAAKVWPDPSGGNRLSAYIVGKQGATPAIKDIRDFLKLRIPEYMIPTDIVVLNSLPITSNGKVDRKSLQPPVVISNNSTTNVPSTEQEQRLAAIWIELLDIRSVSLDDNFFDLGGHSLLVARLQQRIHAAFGQAISMAAIFHSPTIADQVALLEPDDAIDRSRLIPLQPRGTKPKLFWLQPPPLIQNLVRSFGPDQPIFGVTISPEDLHELSAEPSIEVFAQCCVETIIKAQQVGPYYIGGLCTSGILAYEVAVQLELAGHTVASLVMLDAENPVFYRRIETLSIELAKLHFYGQRTLRRGGFTMFLRHMRSRLMRLINLEKAAATEMSAIEGAILSAAFRYKPPTYAGNVLLLLPRDRPSRVDYLPGWKTVATCLTCLDVDGHHDELLDSKNAAVIAQALSAHFERVRSDELVTLCAS
ncbi:non-ribosomal peptide synthetase [Granulicella arctica]|uniref:non-ribosomal peptide synthetase n=1 Tax=Granulicella arctica TaxID=940613 RepID=UPI0021E0DE5E|nr:amino acid adenylation domain-containing protein [Granulicella arctica]